MHDPISRTFANFSCSCFEALHSDLCNTSASKPEGQAHTQIVEVARRTYGIVAEVEIQQVFILNLCHLDYSLILQTLLVSLHLGPHQLVPLVGVEPLPHSCVC